MSRSGQTGGSHPDVKVKLVENDESTHGYTTPNKPQRVDTTDDAWTGSVWQEGEDGGVMEDDEPPAVDAAAEPLKKAETPPPSMQRLRAAAETREHHAVIAETPFIAAIAGIAAFALTVLATLALLRVLGWV